LNGKIALVTGGQHGDRLAIAARLAGEGSDVVITARNAKGIEDAARQLADKGGSVIGLTCDVCSTEAVDRLAAEIEARFGRLDILVNNAGGIQGFTDFNGLTDDDWQVTWELNVMSLVRMVPRLPSAPRQRARQPDGQHHLRSGRPARAGLSAIWRVEGRRDPPVQSLSKELGKDGIAVNCVSPGIIVTEGVVDGWKQTAELNGIPLDQVIDQFMKFPPRGGGARQAGRG